MTVYHDRVCQRTGTRTKIEDHPDGSGYLVSCEHGVQFVETGISKCIEAVRHPYRWCEDCSTTTNPPEPVGDQDVVLHRGGSEWILADLDGRVLLRTKPSFTDLTRWARACQFRVTGVTTEPATG